MLRRYVIERGVPGIGGSTGQGFRDIARQSNAALDQLAGHVQWDHSYVAGDKTFCVYLADSEEAVRRHAELSGFPADIITEITAVIDPTTANTPVA